MILNHFHDYRSVSVGARCITQCPILILILIPIPIRVVILTLSLIHIPTLILTPTLSQQRTGFRLRPVAGTHFTSS
jgi:hypothetical protein